MGLGKRFGMASAALVLTLVGCESGEPAKPAVKGTINISGSSTVAPVASKIADKFGDENPGVKINVEVSTSTMGSGNVHHGMADLGLMTQPLRPDQTDLKEHKIARDALAVIVHKDNPVSALTDEQVKGIFTVAGGINNWKDVGGNDATILKIHAADVRASLQRFMDYYGIQQRGDLTAQQYHSFDSQAINGVRTDPNGIAYISIASGLEAIKKNTAIKMIGFGGKEPTVENVANGSYPEKMSYTLTMITKGEGDDVHKAFIAFAQSDAVKPLIEESYLAPLKK